MAVSGVTAGVGSGVVQSLPETIVELGSHAAVKIVVWSVVGAVAGVIGVAVVGTAGATVLEVLREQRR